MFLYFYLFLFFFYFQQASSAKIKRIKVSIIYLCLWTATSTWWSGPFFNKWMSDLVLSLPSFIEIPVINANSVDHDMTPLSLATLFTSAPFIER